MTYKYSPHQMLLRQEALKILLGQFGSKNNEKVCLNIKVISYMNVPNGGLQQVILNCDGIIKHFLIYYGGYNAENY